MNNVELMVLSIAEEIGIVLVDVRFKGGTKTYTYLAEKSAGVVAGDSVVVNSLTDGLVCVEVMNVRSSDEIDTNVSFTYQWIVQRVDTTAYKLVKEREQNIRAVLRKAELIKARNEALQAFKASLGENVLVEVYEAAGITKVEK